MDKHIFPPAGACDRLDRLGDQMTFVGAQKVQAPSTVPDGARPSQSWKRAWWWIATQFLLRHLHGQRTAH